ncbi:hypothetical protein SAMN06265795_104289 [Noviherbaspirillum humi]|uniref:Uncharacterized protein n=1 Tax=Noviherbaspirillum humi TaxID=1688639 RepID=A0A239G8D6_9BURK|nr:hypothetical protein [Noviherbaspirillum humi]SNS65205.1 hypothetical protein SAMN06265795_104289 [Noviherbaspirillum humi]
MSKIRQSNKESKKKPILTPREKKAAKSAKQAKSHGPDLSRVIVR